MKIIQTGSRVYGLARPDSDWNFVVHIDLGNKIKKFLIEHKIEIKYNKDVCINYKSFIFIFAEEKFQIIVVTSKHELDFWEYATEQMKFIHFIINHAERVKKFRKFYNKALFKYNKKEV